MTVRGYVLISLCAASLAMAAVVLWRGADTDRAGASVVATPTAAHGSATPVPKSVPAAPSNLRLTGASDGLAWTDNSTDETGFVVIATDNISRIVQKFSVPANTTSFQLPPGARANCAERRPSMSYAVMAVNAVGTSGPAFTVIRSACPGDESPVSAGTAVVSGDTMVVSGAVPVAPGSSIVVEALDAATIRGVECARGQTGTGPADSPSSLFLLTVERACVQRASGNLRVCWGEGQCQGFEFQPGQRLELGIIVLRTPIASAPDVGFGPDARRGSGGVYDSVRTLAAAGFALVGVGALLFAGSRLARVKRRFG